MATRKRQSRASDGAPRAVSPAPGFRVDQSGKKDGVLVAASTVAIVAIAAAVIVVALLVLYVLPRGGRRKRPPRP